MLPIARSHAHAQKSSLQALLAAIRRATVTTQATVSESLESLRVTRVVIAHRLSTIRHADKIVVLEGGKVVQIRCLTRTDRSRRCSEQGGADCL